MNCTHRITLKHWGCWYLIDISNTNVVYPEDNQSDAIGVYNGWFEDIKSDETFQMEELNFSLENE